MWGFISKLFCRRTDAQKTGHWAEELASKMLKDKGLQIESRNWSLNWAGRKGELDLIAREGRQLVFVEVRARSAEARVSPYFSISAGKKRSLRRAISSYLRLQEAKNGTPEAWRFDIIEVSFSNRKDYQLTHHEGVTL